MNKATMTRWYPLRSHREQSRLWSSPARFRVAACGRRSGKSELAKRKGVSKAVSPSPYPDFRVLFGGPTYQQAKRVFWSDVKKLVPRWALLGRDPRKAISEGELTIRLQNGAEIIVTGLDAPMRVEGSPLDFVVCDESADVKESAWLEHIRPGLSERGGEAWLIGTPDGRNWFWQAAQKAQDDDSGLWSFHTWPSSTVLDPEEIAIAKSELDERTFAQEYNASFLDATGRVYYAFDRDVHVEQVTYDPKLPLILCMDFNVSPGTATVCQEQPYTGDNPAVDRTKPVTVVLSEVWIKNNSNTIRVSEEFLSRHRDHKGELWVYGDAAGGARGTSQTQGSDWDLVRKCLDPVFGARQVPMTGGRILTLEDRFYVDVPRANPAVRSRINAVNSRLRSASGTVRMIVDSSCKHLIEDFEGVCWDDKTGDIDKKSSPMLTHLSDGLGYYVAKEHPLVTDEWEIKVIY